MMILQKMTNQEINSVISEIMGFHDDFTNNITAAFKIIDKFSDQYSFSCFHVPGFSSVTWGWNASFKISVYPPERTKDNFSQADSLPLAICLALLNIIIKEKLQELSAILLRLGISRDYLAEILNHET